jgi:hypothetical protein
VPAAPGPLIINAAASRTTVAPTAHCHRWANQPGPSANIVEVAREVEDPSRYEETKSAADVSTATGTATAVFSGPLSWGVRGTG